MLVLGLEDEGAGGVEQRSCVLANDDLLLLKADPALDYEGINNDTIEPYRRYQPPKMHLM
jgi:hypothetical protein